MTFEISEINRRAVIDPRGFMAECDAEYYAKLAKATASIANASTAKPVVLLSGPSGSGKTTTARKLVSGLQLIGIHAHVISMDDYYMTVTDETHPRDERGNIDYETPDILDIPLLRQHFNDLSGGREIQVPSFDFKKQARKPEPQETLRLGKDEVAVFEGIHALNPKLLTEGAHVTRVYVSARSNITAESKTFFKATWQRLVRRVIRDDNFRGASAVYTTGLWASVRRGEKEYVSPYKNLAEIIIDTTHAYEVNVLRDFAVPLFSNIPDTHDRADELKQIAPKLEQFAPIDPSTVSKKSLLREFIGGLIVT